MGLPEFVDKHGRILEIGDNVVAAVNPARLTWKLKDVHAVMEANQPANLVEAVFEGTLTIVKEHGMPDSSIQLTLSHEDEAERQKAYAERGSGGPSQIIRPS